MHRILHRLVALIAAFTLLPVPQAMAGVWVSSVSFSSASSGAIAGFVDTAVAENKTGFVSFTDDGGQTFRALVFDNFPAAEVAMGTNSFVVAPAGTSDSAARGTRTSVGTSWTVGRTIPVLGETAIPYYTAATMIGSRTAFVGYQPFSNSGHPARIVTSVDGGSTWTSSFTGPTYPLPSDESTPPAPHSSLAGVDAAPGGQVAWAVGTEGRSNDGFTSTYVGPLILKSSDGGVSWQKYSVPLQLNGVYLYYGMNDVAAVSANTMFATDTESDVLRTSDGGVTWSAVQLPADSSSRSNPYMDILAMDGRAPGKLVLAGQNGKIAWTTDATVASPTWQFYNAPTGHLKSIAMIDDNKWIAVGDDETVVRTTNAGATWTAENAKPPVASILGPAEGTPFTEAPMVISGSAADSGSGVRSVALRIRRSDGKHWNGLGWQTQEHWLTTNSSDYWATWSYTWANPFQWVDGRLVSVTAKATDVAGLVTLSAPVTLGQPVPASLSLDGGAAYTTTSTVTAQVSATDATHMRWRVNAGAWSTAVPFATTATVNLGSVAGTKTVDFQFSMDAFQTVLSEVSRSILLHTSRPALSVTSPSAGFSLDSTVTVSGQASDVGASVAGVSVRVRRSDGMYWSGSAWTATETWLPAESNDSFANWSYAWKPSAVLVSASVAVKAVDQYGLVSDTTYVGSAIQQGVSVTLASGSSYTATAAVTADVAAPNATYFRWSGDVSNPQSEFVAIADQVDLQLSGGDGPKSVTFEFSNNGTVAETSTVASTYLHRVSPTVAVTAPASSEFPLVPYEIDVAGTAAGGVPGLSKVELRIRRADNRCWTGSSWQVSETWIPVATTDSYSTWDYSWVPDAEILATDEIVSIVARVEDAFGLTTTSDTLYSGLSSKAQMMLFDGATYTSSTQVPVTIASRQANYMRWSVDGQSPTSWVPVSAVSSVTIPAVDGTRTVTFDFSVDGSRTSCVAEDQIIFDGVAPGLSVTSPAAAFTYRTPVVSVEGTVADDLAGVSSVDITVRQGESYWNGSQWVGDPRWIPADIEGDAWHYDWIPSAEASASGKPVTITARAVDRAGNQTIASRTSLDPLDTTTFVLTSSSATISYGGTAYMKGTFYADGVPASGTIELWEKPYNVSSYRKVTSSSATSLGAFSFSRKPSVKTSYQVRYAKSSTRLAGSSGYVTYTPKAYLTTPSASSSVRAGSSFSMSGYLKPRHSSGSKVVRIYRYKKQPDGTYKSYGYVSLKVANYSSYSRYYGSMSLASKGSWRIRAYHSDWAHAGTYSSYRYVTVK